MARLPIPGADEGSWGNVLNDFLSQTHKSDGTLKAGVVDTSVLTNGSVTNAVIQDGSVAAEKLSAAAGTNGQALVKDTTISGGLRWQTVSGSTTDLTASRTSTTVTVESSSGADVALVSADSSNAGILSATDKTKLDGIASGAQVNTVSSVAGKTGAVTLVKADVGLANVDNTSDASKPVSTATQTALDTKSNTLSTINAQTGTSYTLVLTDVNKFITLTNAAAITVTVPSNASVAFAVGTHISLAQLGAGQVTFVPAGGVTVNADPGLKIATQYGGAELVKLATDTWLLVGRLSA